MNVADAMKSGDKPESHPKGTLEQRADTESSRLAQLEDELTQST